MHPEDAQSFLEALERSRNVTFKARLRRPGGEWAWTRWCVDRGLDGYRGVVMDLAEQERLQERRLHAEHRKGARDMARHFVQRYQKHFRGALDVLRALTGTNAQVDAAIDAMGDADHLLDALQDFAVPDPTPKVPIHLNGFIQDVLLRAARAAGPGIDLKFDPGADLPEVLLAPAPMEDALCRLIENAREALGGTGAIRVATGLQYPRGHRPGSLPGPMVTRVFIEVRDQGPGVPPALLGQVFEPFVTTHPDPSRGGLGLATVREVVEAHQGTVHLASLPGKGTVVRILIPV
jgi:signal transduction histidine kinase